MCTPRKELLRRKAPAPWKVPPPARRSARAEEEPLEPWKRTQPSMGSSYGNSSPQMVSATEVTSQLNAGVGRGWELKLRPRISDSELGLAAHKQPGGTKV